MDPTTPTRPNSSRPASPWDDYAIRPATVTDTEAIREIYNAEVLGALVNFDLVPRSHAAQRAWIADREGAMIVLVAEARGRVLGFASTSPYRDRPAYRTTVESSVYVHRSHQRRGIGKTLLVALAEAAKAQGFHSMIARIVGGHDSSVALHRGCGFAMVGVEREVGRKLGQWLDVVVMQRML